MAAEDYQFEFKGARFPVTIDLEAGSDETTTEPPNLRVIEGTWKTWRLSVVPDVLGIEGIRLRRSVSSGGGEHPAGNLTTAESGTGDYWMMMVAQDGRLYRVPVGYGTISRMYTSEEWRATLDEWEASL